MWLILLTLLSKQNPGIIWGWKMEEGFGPVPTVVDIFWILWPYDTASECWLNWGTLLQVVLEMFLRALHYIEESYYNLCILLKLSKASLSIWDASFHDPHSFVCFSLQVEERLDPHLSLRFNHFQLLVPKLLPFTISSPHLASF